MYRVLRAAYVVLALGFMAFVVAGEWDKLRAAEWQYRADLFLLSVLLAAATYALNGYGWHLVLKALGYDLPARRTIHVWILASLARYIPGGVWSLASRVALAKAEGVGVAEATVSLYIEQMLLMAASLAVGLVALIHSAGLSLSPLAAIGLLAVFALLLHPRIVALVRYVPGQIGKAFAEITIPSTTAMLRLYGFYLLIFTVLAAVFVCFVSSVHPVSSDRWVLVGTSMPLAFFAGFVVLFAPGGIGIRESVLYLLLLPYLPSAEALGVSVASRLWLLAAELVTVAAATAYMHLASRMKISAR